VSVMTMTSESISVQLGVPVPDMYVTIAKNSVVGMESSTIAELLGATREEIEEIELDETYRNVRLLIAGEYAKSKIETDFSWNSLEEIGLRNLHKTLATNRDPEFNLKVAVMANRANRRVESTGGKMLDPSSGGARVPISLTSRIVKRLNQKSGDMEIEETRTVSLQDGSAVNPTFEDIDRIFGVSATPRIAQNLIPKARTKTIDIDRLAEEYMKGGL
jgi:hypothetical protein